MELFLTKLASLPDGYSQGTFARHRYGLTVTRRSAGRQIWLYAEALGGDDVISFNLYNLMSGPQLRPCEMSSQKVIEFVLGFQPDGS